MTEKIKLAKDKIKSNYSGGDSYDLIIIGAGISGLSSAVMWLLNTEGKKTLILEKNGYTGGYVTAYEKNGYIFETTQLFPDLTAVLDYIGLDLNLKRYKTNFMRRIVVHGDEVDEYKIPTGPENFAEYLSGIFPEDAKKIKKLMDYSVMLFSQVRKLKALPKSKDMALTPFVAPKVVMSLNRTYSDLLDKFGITNIKLREVLDTFAAFSGVPSDRASAILATGAMLSSMTKCFRPYGFYDEFPAKMTQLFQKLGGELLLSALVEKIVVENGKAVGVKVKGEKGMIRAKKIITTIDPMVAMHKLVGDDNLPPKYVERLKNTVMSPSSINIALGLDDKIDLKKMDIDYPYNVVSTGTGTMGKLFDSFLAGDNAFTDDCFHAGAICPSLTTGAKNTITIRGVPFGMNNWLKWRENDRKRYKEEKERWGDFFVEKIEKYLVRDLSRHIVVKDISTPATYSRYSGSPTGSIYDMASLVTQFGPKRLPMKTPIEDLYQPKFSHSIYGTMMNGIQVVDLILDRAFNDGNSLFNPRKG